MAAALHTPPSSGAVIVTPQPARSGLASLRARRPPPARCHCGLGFASSPAVRRHHPAAAVGIAHRSSLAQLPLPLPSPSRLRLPLHAPRAMPGRARAPPHPAPTLRHRRHASAASASSNDPSSALPASEDALQLEQQQQQIQQQQKLQQQQHQQHQQHQNQRQQHHPQHQQQPALVLVRDRFKVQRRVLVGVAMGVVVIAFVFSGRLLFTLGMLATSLTGLFEYYRMVAAKGHLPAYKMGLCVTATTMLASAYAPSLADTVFPLGGTLICIYLLFRRGDIATIADISTTFMGLFYAGYLPSYWVRLHAYAPSTAAENIVAAAIAKLWPSAFGLMPRITVGSLLVFWTWLSAASADIAAFFFGRTFGRTPLSNISPKKTVEGAIAGFLCSASISMLGAYLLRWPFWCATGAVYGFTVAVLGLCGDLFESCFKRDVGWKDSGSLFAGHGGVLDRADSYVLVAPLVYFFATLVLPFLSRIAR